MGKKKKNAEEHTLLFYQVSLLLPLLLPLLPLASVNIKHAFIFFF